MAGTSQVFGESEFPNHVISSPPLAVSSIDGLRSVEENFEIWDGDEALSFKVGTDGGGMEPQISISEVGSSTLREGMRS